jgi:hypothetical protein
VWGRHLLRLAVGLFTLLVVSAAHAQVRVTAEWDRNSDPYTVGYRVFVGLASGNYSSQFNADAHTRLAMDLPQGQVYYLVVRAYDAQSRLGPPSSEVVIDLGSVPEAPTGIRASIAGGHTTLLWNPPAGGGRPIRYLVSVGRALGAADVVSGYDVGAVLSASGVLPPGVYFARVQAVNVIGLGPPSDDISFQISSSLRLQGPTNLSVRWQGASAVLSWVRPIGGSGPDMPTAYVIEAGTAAGLANIASINVGGASSFTTSVPPGTYYVRVRGVSAGGSSDASNEIMLQGAQLPGAPVNLRASGTGSTVSLQWTAPAGGSLSGYVVEAGTAPGQSNIGVMNVGPLTSISTTASPGIYYVRVRAVNGQGTSAPSNEIIVRR